MNPDQNHPAQILRAENKKIRRFADRAAVLSAGGELHGILAALGKLKQHYGIIEELILPLIDTHMEKRDVAGVSRETMPFSPDDVWKENGRIKKELGSLIRQKDSLSCEEQELRVKTLAVDICAAADREDLEIIPLSLSCFTEEEWFAVYRDLEDAGLAFTESLPRWESAEKWIEDQRRLKEQQPVPEGLIQTESGSLTREQLEGILKKLPVDMTFIDENDTVRFYTNEGKTFSRVQSAIGRPVYQCHPPAKQQMVRKMIESFKSGAKDHVDVWLPKGEGLVRVRYQGVRGNNGKYLGTLELVEEFADVLEYLNKKKRS